MSEAQAMLAARLTEVEAIRLVTLMVADKADAAADRSYIRSLAGYLMQQPRAVAIACCDPHRGLATEVFVRPVIADIARWCARESEPIAQVLRDDVLRRRFGPPEGELDREGRPTIDELRARLGPTFGLKGMDKFDEARGIGGNANDTEEALRRNEQQNRDALAASNAVIAQAYAGLGVEPMGTGWGDMLISPTLAATLGRLPAKARKKRRAA